MSHPTDGGLRSWVTRRRVLSGAAAAGAAGMLGRSALGQSTPAPESTLMSATPVNDTAQPGFNPIEVVLALNLISPPTITDEQLSHVASIVNAQVMIDFGPVWGVHASVTAARQGIPISPSAWPIFISKSLTQDPNHGLAQSGHDWQDPNTKQNRPYGYVAYEDMDFLAHSVSHECLEMLANPYKECFHWHETIDPKGADKTVDPKGIGKVLFAHEVCDPCSTPENGYMIDDMLVSDFVNPRYFDAEATVGASYSFRGNVTKPYGVRPCCSQNWLAPDLTSWFQGIEKGSGIVAYPMVDGVKVTCP